MQKGGWWDKKDMYFSVLCSVNCPNEYLCQPQSWPHKKNYWKIPVPFNQWWYTSDEWMGD